MKTRLSVLGLLAASLALAPANAQTRIYFNNFEDNHLGPEWSANSRITPAWPTFTNFNGNYSSGYTTLTLPQPQIDLPSGFDHGTGSGGGSGGGGGGDGPPPPPPPAYVLFTLTFDFYCIDSWDGSNFAYGQDFFNVSINDSLRFHETFTNQPGVTQSFRAPDVGPRPIDFNANANDSIYRAIAIDFTLAQGDPITIKWFDGGLQGMNDESWGIDNVNLGYSIVPAPASASLLLGGLLSLRRNRRPAK